MNNARFLMPKTVSLAFCFLTFALGATAVTAAELKIQAQLVWGTNDEKSPNPKHKEVDPALAKKLNAAIPFKWENFFEIERQTVTVSEKTAQKITLSKNCTIEVKNLGDERVEVKLFGEEKFVSKTCESLTPGQTLIMGGDAQNKTAWLIVLKNVN